MCLLMAHWSLLKVHINLNLLFFSSKVYLQFCIIILQIVNRKDEKVTWLNFSYILATSALNFDVTWGIGWRIAV